MYTDPARGRRKDPGNPDVCNLFPYHVLLASKEDQEATREGCVTAGIGCVDCKKLFIRNLQQFLGPFQERRRKFESMPGAVEEILAAGNARAEEFAARTMGKARSLMGL